MKARTQKSSKAVRETPALLDLLLHTIEEMELRTSQELTEVSNSDRQWYHRGRVDTCQEIRRLIIIARTAQAVAASRETTPVQGEPT